MRTRLIAAAGLVLAATPVTVAAAPAAAAAEPCTPSVTIGKPFQDPGGFVVFPATYSVCDSTRVTVKFRDRDTDSGWAGGLQHRVRGLVGHDARGDLPSRRPGAPVGGLRDPQDPDGRHS